MKNEKNKDNIMAIGRIIDYCFSRIDAAEYMVHEIKRWHRNGNFAVHQKDKYIASWLRIIDYNRTVLDTASELMNYLMGTKQQDNVND